VRAYQAKPSYTLHDMHRNYFFSLSCFHFVLSLRSYLQQRGFTLPVLYILHDYCNLDHADNDPSIVEILSLRL